MGLISLEGIEFFAFHGYHEEEQKIGNRFTVDLNVEVNVEKAGEDDRLTETVDYQQLYNIVKSEIEKPSKLLENIGHRIITASMIQYPHIESVEVTISKHNPPVGGICKRASITLKEFRKDLQ